MNTDELIKYFKSITLYTTINEKEKDFRPSTKSIVTWLENFHAHFRDKLKIDKGNNLHTLYNREVSIHGEHILSCYDKLKEIALFSKSIGYGFSITLDIAVIIKNFGKIEQLIKENVITSLGVIVEEPLDTTELLSPEHHYATTLLKLANYNLSIGLIADIEVLYRLGILNNTEYNSLSFTIYPLTSTPSEYFTKNPITSCSRHFRILVDDNGLIYTCLGLFGLEEFAVGSIYTSLNESVFGAKKSNLNYHELIQQGPTLSTASITTQKRITGLPQMCELHRISVAGWSETSQ